VIESFEWGDAWERYGIKRLDHVVHKETQSTPGCPQDAKDDPPEGNPWLEAILVARGLVGKSTKRVCLGKTR